MDRLTQEKETAVQEKVETTSVQENSQESHALSKQEKAEEVFVSAPPPSAYLNSFENITISDIKKEEEKKKQKAAEQERQRLVQQELARQEAERQKAEQEAAQQAAQLAEQEKSVNIIEKPNYDLLEEGEKIVKIKKPQKPLRKKAKKVGLALTIALAASGIICVGNFVLIDSLQSSYVQIEEGYNLKLGKYLRDINNLDAAKKGMELVETYPDDLLDAGDLGQKSNWFDRLCNFLGGLFGG